MLACLPPACVACIKFDKIILPESISGADASSEEWRKEAHNVTGRRLEKIAGCVASVRCLQKERSRKEERKEYCMNGDDLLLRDTMTATRPQTDTAVRRFVNLKLNTHAPAAGTHLMQEVSIGQ